MYLSVRVCVSVFFCGCVSYVCGFMCIFLLVELCLFVGTFDNVMCKSLLISLCVCSWKYLYLGEKVCMCWCGWALVDLKDLSHEFEFNTLLVKIS